MLLCNKEPSVTKQASCFVPPSFEGRQNTNKHFCSNQATKKARLISVPYCCSILLKNNHKKTTHHQHKRINSSLENLLLREEILSPLVVPKIICSLFTSHNFDHCANSHSLYRPQGAVVFLAPSLSAKAYRDDKLSHHRYLLLATCYLLLAICYLLFATCISRSLITNYELRI